MVIHLLRAGHIVDVDGESPAEFISAGAERDLFADIDLVGECPR